VAKYEDCERSKIGFSSLRDLKRHISDCHEVQTAPIPDYIHRIETVSTLVGDENDSGDVDSFSDYEQTTSFMEGEDEFPNERYVSGKPKTPAFEMRDDFAFNTTRWED
jgi:hypothetical protein